MEAQQLRERSGETFSGHESFVCRYGWLPKLYDAISHDPTTFANDENAIVALGIGRNMVKSIRFWGQAFGLTDTRGREVALSKFAKSLLDPKTGTDPYLENLSSLWQLHWRLSTKANLGAWNVAFLDVRDAEINQSRFIDLVRARARLRNSSISPATVNQHVDIFLRTYDFNRLESELVHEETLGAPLQELKLIDRVKKGNEDIIRFHTRPKPGLDLHAFGFALSEFWTDVAPNSQTMSFREIAMTQGSPGAVYRLDEHTVFEMLRELSAELQDFELQEDGVGGFSIFCKKQTPHAVLEGEFQNG